MSEDKGTLQRSLVGKVVSNKMEKSGTVLVERRVKHAMYGKYMTRSTKYHFHDDSNETNIGDVVRIKSCRPISKTKSWTLDKVITKAV
ncbi:30S ribosomal protein S17 [Chromatiales bacterium (ex Bugula neritina AB1)]|nr:30S ribosomal protein S17 [Chromatiales bacterium (ex Bugula neritina AB1)]